MKKFEENKRFLGTVKSNNVFNIKSGLENLIVLLNGDKDEINRAVEYARKNSDFDWEEDDEIYAGEVSGTLRDKYINEKGKLVRNFTKERYEKTLELYREYAKERDANRKKATASTTYQRQNKRNRIVREREAKKALAITAGIAVVAILGIVTIIRKVL